MNYFSGDQQKGQWMMASVEYSASGNSLQRITAWTEALDLGVGEASEVWRRRRTFLDLVRRWDSLGEAIPLAELTQGLEVLELAPDDLAEAMGYDIGAYRWAVVHAGRHYEVLVLCWGSGQSSPIHDHRGSNCVVKVIQGRATETRFSLAPCGRIAPVVSQVYSTGSVMAYCGVEIHQLANLEAAGHDLITLHVYSPSPSNWRAYRTSETTLAENDRLIHKPGSTVRVEFGQLATPRAEVSRTQGGLLWRR
jgi:cysteine dioxygenase